MLRSRHIGRPGLALAVPRERDLRRGVEDRGALPGQPATIGQVEPQMSNVEVAAQDRRARQCDAERLASEGHQFGKSLLGRCGRRVSRQCHHVPTRRQQIAQ
jgi:hypothetical protein